MAAEADPDGPGRGGARGAARVVGGLQGGEFDCDVGEDGVLRTNVVRYLSETVGCLCS